MPRLLALLRELVRFSSAGVAPRKLLVCGTHLRNRRRAAHPHQPGEIARTHTAMRSRRRPPPARRAPFSRTQLHPASQAAHNHSVRRAVWRTNTHSGPCSWRARRHRSYRTAHARRAPTQRRHAGRVPARPRLPPTAHNCMARPAPHTTRQRRPHRHLRRPHRVARTPGPSPLYQARPSQVLPPRLIDAPLPLNRRPKAAHWQVCNSAQGWETPLRSSRGSKSCLMAAC